MHLLLSLESHDVVLTVSTLKPTSEKTPQLSAAEPPSAKNVIDMETFQQILDLDEDSGFEFSQGMVDAYFLQAQTTFDEMDAALYARSSWVSPAVADSSPVSLLQ
jgi:hypothetical protein